MIEAVVERCAGIDVGKKFVLVCLMTGAAKDEPQSKIKKFGTIVSELERLAAWLVDEGCTHAVMESTGSYWKPVFNLLESHVRVILANAADVQNRRGHKTDPNDIVVLRDLEPDDRINTPTETLVDMDVSRMASLRAATHAKLDRQGFGKIWLGGDAAVSKLRG